VFYGEDAKAPYCAEGAKNMPKMTRRTWLAAAGMTSVAVGVGGSAWADDEAANPRHFKDVPPRELIQKWHLPNVELVTQEGRRVHFYDDLVKDKVVVINFIYTNCQKACPPIMANLVKVQKLLHDRIGNNIFMYSITLKPKEDGPQELKKYATTYDIGPGWLLLTGKPEDVELLRASLGFKYRDPAEDADKSNHIGMVRIGNEPMMRWSACEGQARAQWIATTILREADVPFQGGTKPAAAVAGVK
jgi:protein SCO1